MESPVTRAPDLFKDALRRCREVAECEYAFADHALRRTELAANRLGARIASTLEALPSGTVDRQGMCEGVHGLGRQLDDKVNRLIHETRENLSKKRPRLRKFTIALFGRTMAGKSTIREAITGGDGSSIGDGGQNTTKRVHEYEWRGIHIFDTPGIGSYQGNRFRQQALGAVSKSDLVVFLLTSDKIPIEDFEGMRDVLAENKPVFFVLNVKRDLRNDLYRERFLRNPDSVLGREKIDGLIRRIKLLAADGFRPRRWVPQGRVSTRWSWNIIRTEVSSTGHATV
jgi:GTP-binding protein EngB required for normal cell division